MKEHKPREPSLAGIIRCEACDETWPCEAMKLRAALVTCESWIDRWTQHVGRCEGDDRCTCGRTAILYEARAVLGDGQ